MEIYSFWWLENIDNIVRIIFSILAHCLLKQQESNFSYAIWYSKYTQKRWHIWLPGIQDIWHEKHQCLSALWNKLPKDNHSRSRSFQFLSLRLFLEKFKNQTTSRCVCLEMRWERFFSGVNFHTLVMWRITLLLEQRTSIHGRSSLQVFWFKSCFGD